MTSNQADVCNDAGLFITFYIKAGVEDERKNKEQSFIELVSRSFSLSEERPDYWCDDEKKIGVMLLRYAFLQHDTTVVQLAMNAKDVDTPAGEAWKDLSERFEKTMLEIDLDIAWGYTMVFQAARSNDSADERETLKKLLEELKTISHETFEKKEQNRLKGGILQLIGLPKESEFKARGRVITYMAISDSGDSEEAALVYEVLLGDNAKLVWHNLIIHKGYYQYLQVSSHKREFSEVRQRLRDAGRKLLIGKESRHRFDDIFVSTQKLQDITNRIHDIQMSLDQQVFNYEGIQEKYEFCENLQESNIVKNYNRILKEMCLSIELLVRANDREVKETLQKIELSQARIKDTQAEWEQEKQWMLALLAASLAVPQLVDSDAAWSIIQSTLLVLQAIGYNLPFDTNWDNTVIQLSMPMRMAALAMQIFLICVVFFFLKWVISKFNEQGEK